MFFEFLIFLYPIRGLFFTKTFVYKKLNPKLRFKAKSSLNRGILDQRWGIFSSMLDYKLEESGGQLVKVCPRYTSQICPCCNYQEEENRKSQFRFVCENWGHAANADDVGAINILARGHRVLACGVGSLEPSMEQEPVGSSDTSLLVG